MARPSWVLASCNTKQGLPPAPPTAPSPATATQAAAGRSACTGMDLLQGIPVAKERSPPLPTHTSCRAPGGTCCCGRTCPPRCRRTRPPGCAQTAGPPATPAVVGGQAGGGPWGAALAGGARSASSMQRPSARGAYNTAHTELHLWACALHTPPPHTPHTPFTPPPHPTPAHLPAEVVEPHVAGRHRGHDVAVVREAPVRLRRQGASAGSRG